MKHIKSRSKDLYRIFDNVSVKHIAEPLASFDEGASSSETLAFIKQKNFDTVGVQKQGLACGYAKRSDLASHINKNKLTLGDHIKEFEPILDESAPLIAAFRAMRDHNKYLFVSFFDRVVGIVSRGDMQKIPVRLWLWGLISLLELQLLRAIIEIYPDSEWDQSLTDSFGQPLGKKLFNKLKKTNSEINLAECLSFNEKKIILLNSEQCKNLIFTEENEPSEQNKFWDELGKLRNNLAHYHNIITKNWKDVVDSVIYAEKLLNRLDPR